ncbi:MAG: AMP-binding protein, partial [Parasporobacterium sp.]|nr:AMP-binding protein [Parasporobacterium sp.]
MGDYEIKAAHINPVTASDPVTVKTPWKNHLGDLPFHLDYFDGSLYDAVKAAAEKYPNNIAFDFMGKSTTYKTMISEIQKCARSFKTLGVREGDRVTIALPNCPQAIYSFYGLNCIGAIANMVHPLSAEKELEFYINASKSVTVVTLDQFYNKIEAIRQNTCLVNVVIASIKDALSRPIKAGYMLTEGRKIKKIPKDAPVIRWNAFKNIGRSCFWNYEAEKDCNETAVILYSGGTTGRTKGIELSSRSFNALAEQIIGV